MNELFPVLSGADFESKQNDKKVQELLINTGFSLKEKALRLETIRQTGRLSWNSVKAIKTFKHNLAILTQVSRRYATLEEEFTALKLKPGDKFYLLNMDKEQVKLTKCQVHVFGDNWFETGRGFMYKPSNHDQEYPNSALFKLKQYFGNWVAPIEVIYRSFGSSKTIMEETPYQVFISFKTYEKSSKLKKLLEKLL